MIITIKTKAEVVAGVPLAWERQYADHSGSEKHVITRLLKSLPAGFTAEEVDEIIGNKTWTRNECSGCGEDSDILVCISDDYYDRYDGNIICLCTSCVSKAAKAIKAAKAGEA